MEKKKKKFRLPQDNQLRFVHLKRQSETSVSLFVEEPKGQNSRGCCKSKLRLSNKEHPDDTPSCRLPQVLGFGFGEGGCCLGFVRCFGLVLVVLFSFGLGFFLCCRSNLRLVKADGKQLHIKIYLYQFPYNSKKQHHRHSQNLISYL